MTSQFYIYCRASTPRVAHPKHSLEGQKKALVSYAKKHGLIISQVFQESGSATRQRPLFSKMLHGIERGEADGILVHDISRLARSAADGQRLIGMLDRGFITQIKTPSLLFNKNSLPLHLCMQQQERDALSRSVKLGLRHRKLNKNLS